MLRNLLERVSVPHTLVLLLGFLLIAWTATHIIPAGAFEMTTDEEGREVVVPGTFETLDEQNGASITELFTVIPRALADAQGIIFFVLIVGGALAVVRETGTIDAMLGRVLDRFGQSPLLLITGGMAMFAGASATFGMAEEYIPFAIILVALCLAMKLDAIVAIGTMVVGYGIGYGVALLNPFTLLVAQDVADVAPGSGMGYRAALIVPFLAVGIHHVWRYAQRIQQDPTQSLVYDVPAAQEHDLGDVPALQNHHWGVFTITMGALGVLVWGIIQHGWYLTELSGLFIVLAIIAAPVGRLRADAAAKAFSKGAAQLAGTALLIGVARAIALIMEDAEVLHTVVYAGASLLEWGTAEVAAVGMLFVQSVLNLVIPSGSGQAFVTMPLMAPIGDLLGVSRQISVLAFQLGDGLMNMIVPTNPVLMGILGLAGIPYDRWLRFIGPLILKLLALSALALVGAVWIGYA